MNELVKVTLKNEMDLIIAHKCSIKLAEMTGLSLSAQTTFATAVSEVSRNTIKNGKNGALVLSVTSDAKDKFIVASITDEELDPEKFEGLEYAKRLVDKYHLNTGGGETLIELFYRIPSGYRLDLKKIDEWRSYFRNQPAMSPYEEIKRSHEQLIELARKLKESEQQYAKLTNSLPIIIFSLNKDGALTYANKWLARITGFSIKELNDGAWEKVIHPDDIQAFEAILKPETDERNPQSRIQCRVCHRSEAEYFWHLASVSPLMDEEGQLIAGIGYIVDIHAQKLVEATLKDNRELKETQTALENNIRELNRSNRELQEFAYVASHDLQEPARKISFYCDFLLNKYEDNFDEKGRVYLKNMFSASQRMRNLINDLLSFAKVEKEDIRVRNINLNDVLSNVVHDLDVLITEKRAEIKVHPLPQIHADENMMHQLFENLISNAVKYSKSDIKPEIEIRSNPVEGFVEIEVRDNGIGFDEKYLPQMFTLFKRLHSSDKYEGTGLGLAICQKIVALHNGQISAKSHEGEGSVFKITLPQQ